ncbi:hypothetical protein D1872_54760 [compost metagenome]
MPKATTLYKEEVGTKDIAEIIGKSTQWVSQLTREGVLQKKGHGKYRLDETIQAYIAYVVGEQGETKTRIGDEKADLTRIKKEMAQLELDEMRGNLHRSEDIQQAWGDMLVEFRKRVTALPFSLANKLAYLSDEKEVRETLNTELVAALKSLSMMELKPQEGENDG